MPTAPLLWLLLGAALWLLVLLGVDSDGLLLVGGCAALLMAVLLTALALPVVAQAVLFLALVAASTALVRRLLGRGPDASPLPASPQAAEAEVIGPFAADGRGRVRWQGQSWAAQALETSPPLGTGQRVTVMGREGNCLLVLAKGPSPAAPWPQAEGEG